MSLLALYSLGKYSIAHHHFAENKLGSVFRVDSKHTGTDSLEFTHSMKVSRQIKLYLLVFEQNAESWRNHRSTFFLCNTSDTSKTHWQSGAETGVCSGWTKS